MKNEIRFTLESKQKPKLAQKIGNVLGTAPHYERVPSCAYDIAGYRLDKEFRKAQAEVEQKKEKPMSQKMFKVI